MTKTSKQGDLFIDLPEKLKVPTNRIRWQAAHRLIPSRFPPISLFERIADPADWEALNELEGMTNPRLRDQAGSISLVPKSRRVHGPGASIVMAPFTHASKDRPTRFSDGTYGIYYAANRLETSLHEVTFHMEKFHRNTDDPPTRNEYRCYEGKVDKTFHVITRKKWPKILSPDLNTYPEAQAFGKLLRDSGSNGIVYPSMRYKPGKCLAAFWPDVVTIPVQTKHIALNWDGTKINSWFDYENNNWNNF